jgi:outer membrane protein assembly factor BamE
MRKIVVLSVLLPLIVSCGLFKVHKVEVEQGNNLSAAQVSHLHTGMSEAQVKAQLGTPALVNILNNHEVDYVYTFQVGSSKRVEKRVTLVFRNGTLASIQKQGL